jgi:hypothetical protein
VDDSDTQWKNLADSNTRLLSRSNIPWPFMSFIPNTTMKKDE